jgi:hypothetical protein
VEIYLHELFTSAVYGSVVSFTPWPLYPRERAVVTHWIGGWVGSRAVLDTGEEKNSHPQPVAQRYTTELSRLLMKIIMSSINTNSIKIRVI